jgi:putative transposase
MAIDKKTDDLLADLVRGRTQEEVFGEEGLLKQLTKRLYEQALNAELAEHLGYEKHAPEGRNKGNSRNGTKSKTLKAGTAKLEIDVPRDRDGTFEPQLVRKRQRRLPGFDNKVIALYARGMTTREIRAHLEELYSVEVSPTLISAVTDSVLDDVKAWQSRPLDPLYTIVYLDALHVKIRDSGRIQLCAVYVAIGINVEGHKDLLGLWIGEAEGAKFWLSVLAELKNRGVEDILVAVVDGLKGFPEAIAAEFPKTRVQLCIVHMVRNSMRYVTHKHRKELGKALRRIYTASSIDAAEHELGLFAAEWDSITPLVSRMWQRNWENLTMFFEFPPEIRRVIYTTNAIESVNAQLRRVIKKRGAFPTHDSVRKVLYLGMMRAKERWTMPIKNWPPALLHLSIVFPGRVTA